MQSMRKIDGVLTIAAALLVVVGTSGCQSGWKFSNPFSRAPKASSADAPKELLRRVTTFEYERVLAHAEKLGFIGFSQDKTSATAAFTPDFAEQDLLDEFRRA